MGDFRERDGLGGSGGGGRIASGFVPCVEAGEDEGTEGDEEGAGTGRMILVLYENKGGVGQILRVEIDAGHVDAMVKVTYDVMEDTWRQDRVSRKDIRLVSAISNYICPFATGLSDTST